MRLFDFFKRSKNDLNCAPEGPLKHTIKDRVPELVDKKKEGKNICNKNEESEFSNDNHIECLKFGKMSFSFEETRIYGIFEPYGYMTWHIELFPEGEKNYIMLNSLVFDDVYIPQQLSNLTCTANTGTNDLYEHTVFVSGEGRLFKRICMSFDEWDSKNQSIRIKGEGVIEASSNSPEITFEFLAPLNFTGLHLFETTKERVQEFVSTYLSDKNNSLIINYKTVRSGLTAHIHGNL